MKFVRKAKKPHLRGPLRHLLIQGSDIFEPAAEPAEGLTIDAIPGLQSAIDAKASASHAHAVSDVTGLQGSLDAKAAAATLTSLASDVSAIDGRLSTVENAGGDGPSAEAFPVGSVFIAVVSTNPGTLLGYGTWSAFGAGRMLVGIDSGDTDFDTVEETGGSKTVTLTAAQSGVAAHSHGVTDSGHVHDLMGFPTATGALTGFTRDTTMSGTPAATGLDTSSATTGVTVNNATPANAAEAHSNMPPYIVCYFWKRTA